MIGREEGKAMDFSVLKAYHGYQSSLIPFSSAHYLYLASWDSTPTGFSSFSNLWVVTPEDKRMLFADPPASSEIVRIYHDFHAICGASISLDWVSENHLLVHCASLDGDYELKVELYLHETLPSRLLAALPVGPPTRFMVSKPVVAAFDFLVNLSVTKGGLTVFGKTETGQPYYAASADRLMLVKQGSATMNGEDLGEVSSPTWPIEFGDAIPTVQPVIKLGTLYLPYEEGMVASA
jgi:hypothetical protein